MSDEREDLLGLLDLHYCEDEEQRTRQWRRAISSLAQLGKSQTVPLEGLDPQSLELGVEAAQKSGLLDDLGWLEDSANAVLNLMLSLPRGETKRLLGRRVIETLHSAPADVFLRLATSMAFASPKILREPSVRARVGLALQLPICDSNGVDSLALALISSPDMANLWLVEGAQGSLPQRRLAAQLIERAAREAWRQHRVGNRLAKRVFRSPLIMEPWRGLHEDREPLTWRHIASARGLLVDMIPDLDDETRQDWEDESSPGQWRRSLTSFAASIAVRGESALHSVQAALASKRLKENPALASSLMYGISSAACFAPEHCMRLLWHLCRAPDLATCEAFIQLRYDQVSPEFGIEATPMVVAALERMAASHDQSAAIQAGALLHELRSFDSPRDSLRQSVMEGVRAYAHQGPNAVREATKRALKMAASSMSNLEVNKDGPAQHYRCLLDLDRGLLEDCTLSLLQQVAQVSPDISVLDNVRNRLNTWLLSNEGSSAPKDQPFCTQFARLRALIHLADTEAGEDTEVLRDRRTATVRTFLFRANEPRPELERMVVVTLARAIDATIRHEQCEISDVLLGALPMLATYEKIDIVREATRLSEVERIAVAYLKVLELAAATNADSDDHLPRLLSAHARLIDSFPWAGTPRVEALRTALFDLNDCLQRVTVAQSRLHLQQQHGQRTVQILADTCQRFAQLCAGARRRLDLADPQSAPFLGRGLRALDLAMAKNGDLESEIHNCEALLVQELPDIFAHVISLALRRISSLPETHSDASEGNQEPPPRSIPRPSANLPVPSQRSVAGYYILNALGGGGAGSVYIACREQDRAKQNPKLFALKRPQYSGRNAEVLSETEFVALFRSEASTLLSLAPHPNLAGFVTFDLGARSGPTLVMDYIPGANLGQLLETRDLHMDQALRILDGIAAGLESMHRLGIGHLDVKPENVVMRDGDPVLVDFGLAGRSFRPACATLYYGAPEVFRAQHPGEATPADIYAFGCLAFETLTGRTLFHGESVGDFVRAHLTHDGDMEPIAKMDVRDPVLLALQQTLHRCLRKDPQQRTNISKVRSDFEILRQGLEQRPWPLRW